MASTPAKASAPVAPVAAKPAAAPATAAPAPAAAPAAAPAVPAATAPVKPRPKVQLIWEPKDLSRRNWLLVFSWLIFALAGLVGTLFYVLRFLFPNVTYEPPLQFKAGLPTEFAPGRVDERFKESNGTWIVRNDVGVLYALSTTCTHLGCTPNWLEAEQKFKCPCHGSGFRKTGINFEGPAPRPLERYHIELADDGQVLVDKSMKFQGEKGEWSNPASFLYV
jgi:cytochrome b6-f complex iron-sulfur subunit